MNNSEFTSQNIQSSRMALSSVRNGSTGTPPGHEMAQNDQGSSKKGMLRAALVVSLLAAVAVCSTLGYLLLKDSEEKLGLQTYESIAVSALSGAQSITQRKLQGSDVMATVLSQTLSNASDWPLIDIPGYIPMAAKVAELSSSNTQSLMVFVKPDEVESFEKHTLQAYRIQGRPEDAGHNDFGFGIYKSDRNDPPMYPDGRIHDPSGGNDWGGIHEILAPLTFHNIPGAGSLMYNVYSARNRGVHLESMMDCVERSIQEQMNSNSTEEIDPSTFYSPKCPVITDMLELQIRPGPAGLLFNPIYPANDPTLLVGFATTSIHWQEVLQAIVPDYVSGLTCVVNTETSSYTYEIRSGQPELVGDGDLHDRSYTHMGQSVILNEIDTGSSTSAVYRLTVYPTDAIFDPFRSNGPMAIALGFAGVIFFCVCLFALYDCLMRQEAHRRESVVKNLVRENRRQANDTMWAVKKEELEFDEPAQVLGQGTFGLVLLAQYRGTSVAVKRVIPPKQSSDSNEKDSGMFSGMVSKRTPICVGMKSGMSVESNGTTELTISPRKGKRSLHATVQSTNADIQELKNDFVEEMRHLSKLRHPCITTVMGAVIEDTDEPMLVLEHMDLGALYDILHNETMAIEGETMLPILRDISQGMRFLHSADPQVIHGDLKAQNILVDGRFRAKVADFGLSQKQKIGGTGTPYWMAPELLRKESANTSASDVFSFGVILYEVYSRKDPYDGEDPKEVLRDVMDKNICKRVKAPKNMPAPIKLLMDDSLQEDPEIRPSFEEIDLRLKRIDAETATPLGNKVQPQFSLFDVFPRHIAEALRDGRKVEPEHKDQVTIFFSDIVGFTTISSEFEPRKVADMLDRLYKKLDIVIAKYDLYKVEIIGDAYMAASNLVKDQPSDHCKRVAQFAIDAIRVANDTLIDVEDPSKGHINIRVGFHTGPVVADVVGHRSLRYSLFGDAVNTASRMESNSEANCINCSEKAASILRNQWPEVTLIDRGDIPIKGKGYMRCYWVHNSGTTPSVPPANLNSIEVAVPEQHPGVSAEPNFVDLESHV